MKLFTTSVPSCSADDIERICRDRFGIQAAAEVLTGERDLNFRLRTANGASFVAKVANAAEDHQLADLQVRALMHLAEVDPSLPAPRVVPTRGGEPWTTVVLPTGGTHVVRVVSYLPGRLMHECPAGRSGRQALATCLARLHGALEHFAHPAARHRLLWDLQNASDVVEFLPFIEDTAQRRVAAQFLRAFEEHVAPRLPSLPAQVVPNDFNPHNILVDPDRPDVVTGILDFGDLVWTARVNDLAIAAAYQLPEPGEPPLRGVIDMAAAYHRAMPLKPGEIDVLFDLIGVRQSMAIAISNWRAARYPENRAYIMRNTGIAWRGLERLATISRADARQQLRAACEME